MSNGSDAKQYTTEEMYVLIDNDRYESNFDSMGRWWRRLGSEPFRHGRCADLNPRALDAEDITELAICRRDCVGARVVA